MLVCLSVSPSCSKKKSLISIIRLFQRWRQSVMIRQAPLEVYTSLLLPLPKSTRLMTLCIRPCFLQMRLHYTLRLFIFLKKYEPQCAFTQERSSLTRLISAHIVILNLIQSVFAHFWAFKKKKKNCVSHRLVMSHD